LTVTSIDYAAVFQQFSAPVLLLTPDLVVADANQAYLDVTSRTRDQLLGRNIFAAFPDNPSDAHASSVQDSKESFSRVLATGKPDFRSFQRYDAEMPGNPGVYETRYWNSNNAPVFGPDGQIVLITHQLEEITERVRKFLSGLQDEADARAAKSGGRPQRRSVPAPRAGNGTKSGDHRHER
jgi:PAS domain-containing protein